MVSVPAMGDGVAVAAGGSGVAVGVSVKFCVGGGLAVTVGLAIAVGAVQAVNKLSTARRKIIRFIDLILLLFGNSVILQNTRLAGQTGWYNIATFSTY